MRLRTALAALAITSCADDAMWWELPPDMLPEERAGFGEACERWNAVAIRQQYIADDGDGTHRVFMRLPEHMVNVDANGEYDWGSHTMHLSRGMEPRQFVMVVVHEQGHALKLGHHGGPGVMNANAGQIEFSADDLDECHRVNACK